MSVKFSIIVVSLNAGKKLDLTLKSICEQTYKGYEVIIKDGGSTDGSLECINSYPSMNINLLTSKDSGIYDAMNQALECATGDYIYYLNCGDVFYNKDVLHKISSELDKSLDIMILYGNIFDLMTNNLVSSNPKMNEFGCYRNVPCHQACFYKRDLIIEHPFETDFKVRADYEQFLWCFLYKNAYAQYIDEIVASYEGGGFSETKEHLRLSKLEHEIITRRYMKKTSILKYKLILILSLAPLRTYMSHNPGTAKIYNAFKSLLYKVKR